MYKQINQPKIGWLPYCLEVDFRGLSFVWFFHYSASEGVLCLGWHGKLEYRVIVCSQRCPKVLFSNQGYVTTGHMSQLCITYCWLLLSSISKTESRACLVLNALQSTYGRAGVEYRLAIWHVTDRLISKVTLHSQDDNLDEQVDRKLKCRKVQQWDAPEHELMTIVW